MTDGGPAFPSTVMNNSAFVKHDADDDWQRESFLNVSPGMTLRDFFAGQAMKAYIELQGMPEDGPDDLWDEAIAERCYAMADAMLKERSKEQDDE